MQPKQIILWQDLLELHNRHVASGAVIADDALLISLRKVSTKAHRIGGGSGSFLEFCTEHLTQSRGQLFQDLMVLYFLNEKQNGYFVEFGATNGLSLSNSYLLEKSYGWNGILAEPAPIWHRELERNRAVEIDHRCVWTKSGETLHFNQTHHAELSTISDFASSDFHAASRASFDPFEVRTISLCDLLTEHNAPKKIDYLSVDTEGSEFEILSAFDFAKYDVSVITVEHNYHETKRPLICELLTGQGYRRVLEQFSLFDDWYVQPGVFS
jgi:FkbM family methyltransferase